MGDPDPTSNQPPLAQPDSTTYWNNNLPASQHTTTCPPALQDIGLRNIQILSGRQEDYKTTSWAECRDLVSQNRINEFQRSPAELRRYLVFMHELKQAYGSVLEFVQRERLRWSSTRTDRGPFEDENDFTVLYNDWPYGIDERITHLVVWTKFVLRDGDDGYLSEESKQLVDEWVSRVFVGCELVWFKNWGSLKSIHALEHFHVMIYDADPALLARITNGDVPMSRR